MVDALLQNGVSCDSCDPTGGSALLRAVQRGISARPSIEAVLAFRADVTREDDLGQSPLTAAVTSAELLEALLPLAPREALGKVLAKAAGAKQRAATRLLLGEEPNGPLQEDHLYCNTASPY